MSFLRLKIADNRGLAQALIKVKKHLVLKKF